MVSFALVGCSGIVANPQSSVTLSVAASDAETFMWLLDGDVVSDSSPNPELVIESADPETDQVCDGRGGEDRIEALMLDCSIATH